MSLRAYFKGGMVLSAGSVAGTLCSFVRNVIIARLLSVEDVGIAATFAMTTSLMQMTSNLALDRLIVQAPDGDEPRLQAAAQAFQFLRGVIGALLLLLLAGPIAALFSIPDLVWAFRLLALIPLFRGLAHLDVHRVQRSMSFGPSVASTLLPQIIVTAIAAPLAWWLKDFRAVLIIVILQAGLITFVTFAAAERRYAWVWDKALIRRIVSFGWPLLINGFLMYAIVTGDRAIVGSAFSMEELGWYSTAFVLTMTPAAIVPRILSTLILPNLSRSAEGAQVDRRSQVTVSVFALAGLAFAVGAWTMGPSAMVLIYGERYAPGAIVVGWLGVMQGARLAKAGPATIALSRANTASPMLANLVRLTGLGLAIVAVALGMGVEAVAVAAVIGEFLSMIAAVLLLKRSKVGVGVAMRTTLAMTALVAVVCVGFSFMPLPSGLVVQFLLGGVVTGVACAAAFGMSVDLRRAILRPGPKTADATSDAQVQGSPLAGEAGTTG